VVDDSERSIIAMLRYDCNKRSVALVVSNLTPVPHFGYRIGVPFAGHWRLVLNTDAGIYGGAGSANADRSSDSTSMHGKDHSLWLDLPGLSTQIYVFESQG
jgi:1,4-alpha-glucan branching enzyme